MPTTTMAKMAIQLQQGLETIQSQDKDGTLRLANDETYTINNKDIRSKAATFVGNQARLLFFSMAQNKICVDVAAVTDSPFEINPPPTVTSHKPQ